MSRNILKYLAAAGLVVSLGTTAAHADMQSYSKTGDWDSMAGINNAGHQQCATGRVGTLQLDNTVGAVMLKYDASAPNAVLLHVTKKTWDIPEGTQMQVKLQIDNVSRLYNAHGEGDTIEIILGANEKDPTTGEPAIVLLANLMKSGKQLYVSFLSGNETKWITPLTGANVEISNFFKCVQYVTNGKPAPQASQPYGTVRKKSATQPF
jgi:hypothetical protein